MVLAPHPIHTGGKSEVQLTKKQAVLLMHDIYKAICSFQSNTWTTHIIEDTTLLEALHVQLVTLLYLYIF